VVSAAPGVDVATPSPAPSTLGRDDGWRADIDAMLAARERFHPDPWHGLDRATWVAAADAVKANLPTLTDEQALVELIRLAAMPGWTGREGHTGIFLVPGSGTHDYPIRTWQFSDGLVITAARAPYDDLVGSRIDAINDRPIEDVLALVEPLAPRDNPSTLLAYAPLYLRVSEVLTGLGVLDAVGPTTFSIVEPDGTARDVIIEPSPADDVIAWQGGAPHDLPPGGPLWLRDTGTPLSWSYLAGSRTLFVQYNAVRRGIDGIAAEILARAKAGDVDRVVVDLRHNGGGDNTTYRPLLAALQDPAVDRPGRLTLLIGRITFSAAANFATEVERTTDARFAGEAMGGSPNLYGDVHRVDLPNSGLAVFIATRYWTRYWQKSTADDRRITIEPDLEIPLSSEDYLAGRDPVLEAVLADTPAGD
jgi:hypothetical protein